MIPFDLHQMADRFVHVRGRTLSYAEVTTDVAIPTTVQAGAVIVVNAPRLEFDGLQRVLIEARIAQVQDARPGEPKPFPMMFNLWRDSTDLATLARVANLEPIWPGIIVTPDAREQTFTLRAWIGHSGIGVVKAGGKFAPASLRISEVLGEDAQA